MVAICTFMAAAPCPAQVMLDRGSLPLPLPLGTGRAQSIHTGAQLRTACIGMLQGERPRAHTINQPTYPRMHTHIPMPLYRHRGPRNTKAHTGPGKSQPT